MFTSTYLFANACRRLFLCIYYIVHANMCIYFLQIGCYLSALLRFLGGPRALAQKTNEFRLMVADVVEITFDFICCSHNPLLYIYIYVLYQITRTRIPSLKMIGVAVLLNLIVLIH